MREIQVPLAPALEQTRIVDKISRLFHKVNGSREHLAKVPEILKASADPSSPPPAPAA